MSIPLPLVIEAVTLVDEAAARQRALDVAAATARLLKAHPESGAAPEEIAALLRLEEKAVARCARAQSDLQSGGTVRWLGNIANANGPSA